MVLEQKYFCFHPVYTCLNTSENPLLFYEPATGWRRWPKLR